MLRIFNAVVHWTHSVCGIPEVMIEFVKIQFTETDPYLGKIRKAYWVVSPKDLDFAEGRIID